MSLPAVQSGHKEGSEDDVEVAAKVTLYRLQDEGGWSLEELGEAGDVNILATKIRQFSEGGVVLCTVAAQPEERASCWSFEQTVIREHCKTASTSLQMTFQNICFLKKNNHHLTIQLQKVLRAYLLPKTLLFNMVFVNICLEI